ncbi:MAG: YraN family protein [Clostridia bacterium]|nr:YraN family protein [Clostridia bacterium]
MLFRTTKEIGDFGERYAARYLRRHGYRISGRNYRHGKYEIYVIAVGFRDILFVEVKTRTYRPEELATAPPPGAAVDERKQRFTRAAARQYLHEHPSGKRPRMDVIEVYLEKVPEGQKPRVLALHHIKAAY